MTDDKPEPGAVHEVTAALDDFMATVLRHLRSGPGDPLEELGLDKAKEELQYWRPDIPGAAGEEPGNPEGEGRGAPAAGRSTRENFSGPCMLGHERRRPHPHRGANA